MRRALLAIAAAVALSSGCNAPAGTTEAGINGATDLAQVGDLLFVTATDANELRVVDLSSSKFVRAPNPLQPLSIPVVDRPILLAKDVVGSDGDSSNPWVYALSANGREVSIVGASADSLRELARLFSTEEVTAIAGRRGPGGESTLYVATFDGELAHVRTLSIPSDIDHISQTCGGAVTGTSSTDPRVQPACLTSEVFNVDCSVIEALTVLPDFDGKPHLAYSVRRTPALETRCAVAATPEESAELAAKLRREASFLLDPSSPTSQTLLDFGGPVRKIVVPSTPDAQGRTHIFGVLDEQSCVAGSNRCRGVVAVDGPGPAGFAQSAANTAFPCGGGLGHLSCDSTGFPMPPIDPGTPLVMGLAVGSAKLNVPGGVLDFAGLISRSDGALQFFDATNLRSVELERGKPLPSGVVAANTVNPDQKPVADAISNVLLEPGAARDEQIRVAFRVVLPGFSGLAAPAPLSTSLPVPVDPKDIVEVGDEVVADPVGGCTNALQQLATVTAISSSATGGGTVTLSNAVTLPTGCTTLSIRPAEGSPRPWVVTGTESGFLGRIAPKSQQVQHVQLPADPVAQASRYFFHPDGFKQVKEQIAFDFGDPGPVLPGAVYTFTTTSGFAPFTVAIDPSRISFVPRLTDFAATAAFREGTESILVAFPSGNAVMQVDTARITAGQDLTLTQANELFR